MMASFAAAAFTTAGATAAQVRNSTALDAPPTAQWITLSMNGDRASCPLSPGFEYSAYVTSKPRACFNWYKPTAQIQHLSYSLELTSTGVIPTWCEDTACGLGGGRCATSPIVSFGGCWTPSPDLDLHVTIDVAEFLPAPAPGRVLEKVCWGERTCDCAEAYMMYTTACNNDAKPGSQDFQVYCEEGLAGFSAYKKLFYATTDGTCAGAADVTDVYTPTTCTAVGNTMAATSMWCGAPCAKWKTLRARYPMCDPPTSGTTHAVDLTKVLGNECRADTPMGECCYAPLGYDGGFRFGTPCDRACAHFGRVGQADEWCSDSRGEYGNCFCGPRIEGFTPRYRPPPPPP